MAGAKIYSTQCAVCHGLPQRGPSFIAKGMFPKPPQLMLPHKGVTDDPVGETYWKVKNGIRLTGMPGFVDNLSEIEMWQVSLLLFSSDKLSPQVLEVLRNWK
jgi:mono/diheme cytochrome c family protein